MSKKIVVVTALIGAYDSKLLDFDYDREKYEFVCYTNIKRLKSSTWNIRYVDDLVIPNDNAKSSYWYKWNPHKYLDTNTYDTMVWVDSSFISINMAGLDNFIDRFNRSGNSLFIEKHPSRNTLKGELDANVKLNKDNIDAMTNQVSRYFSEGYPESATVMVETGLSIRKFNNPNLIKFSESIWNELAPVGNTKRDQLVYDYCMWKTSFTDYSLFSFADKMEVIRFTDHPNRSTHKEKVLLIGPWLGEEQYEESWVRFVENYVSTHAVDKVMVGCRPNREPLYANINPDRFIISDPEGSKVGNLLNNNVPRFNISSSSDDKELIYLKTDTLNMDTNKYIHILWATVRADEFDSKLMEWVNKSVYPSRIVPHVLVDTEEDKAKIKTVHPDHIIVSKPPRKGVCYPSYVLSSNLTANPEDIVIYASDDFSPMPKWDVALYTEFVYYNGSVLVNDKCIPKVKEIMTIPIMTYDTLCKLNKIIYHPAYSHCWSDNELFLNLKEMGLMRDLRSSKPQVYFEHKHYINGHREKDTADENNDLSHHTGQSLWNIRQHMPLSERLKYDINEPLLSILILTVPGREHMLEKLMKILNPQLTPEVEVIIEHDNRENTIGMKRNKALGKATGRYISFVDDDDEVTFDYVEKILNIVRYSDVDCCTLMGEISIDGARSEIFIHSLKYPEWSEAKMADGSKEYYRCPNHLNVVRRDIAKMVGFKDISHGEDHDYSTRLKRYLTVEGNINEVIYYYDAITNKVV